jgi:hypothetical protein
MEVKNMIFLYTDYCTTFYAPELASVVVYDEIQDQVLQTIPAGSEAEAEHIMARWLDHSPRGCICETL